MKVLFSLLFAVSSVSCAPQPLGPASKSGKSAPASSSVPSTQAAAMPGQCMGLIGAERDQCLRRFGASGAGGTAPGGSSR